MHHIIYLSRATVSFNDMQLQMLLDQARYYNAQHDVTGILLYGNGQFFQVLEGEEQAVRATYQRISQDPRHRDIAAFADKAIVARAFPEWHMGYRALAPESLIAPVGYVAPGALQLEREGLSLADRQLLVLLRSFVLPEEGSHPPA